MDLTVRRAAALLLLAAGLLLSPTDLSSCGPFLMRALFSVYRQPEQPKERFARGQLGILQPNFPRFYLYIAYRYLTGVPLTTSEQRALFPAAQSEPASRWSSQWNTNVPPSVDQWLEARKKVPGVGDPPKIVVERTISTPTDYYQYTNCLDDAFHSASTTLASRISKFGSASPAVQDWVHGQDAVFANCSGEPPAKLPASVAPDSDPLFKADRTYQLAAANLYAGNLDQAEAMFLQIATDQNSPWRETSAYLVARVQIRKATIKNDAAAMARAEMQLQTVLTDEGLSKVHGPARALAEFVRARLHPEERFNELAGVLVKPDASLEKDLTDYRFLYDKFEEGRFGSARVPQTDDLSDWLWAFHNHGDTHAVEMWRAKKSLPWLLATLQDVHAGNPAASDIVDAADRLKPDSPAFLTAAFHSNRIIIESHREKQARDRLDALLKDRAQLPLSAVNLFLAERMKVAVNWDEFLRYSQRVPVGIAWDEGAEEPAPEDLKDSPLKAYAHGRTTFDADSARILNEQVPLRLIAGAAMGSMLPASLRAEIALAAWTRAVLIDDEKTAADLAPIVATLKPMLKDQMTEYSSAPDKDRRLFAAVYLMLKHPGTRPYIETGFGRLTPTDKIDDFRDNWWCSFDAGSKDHESIDYRERPEIQGPLSQLYVNEQPAASFLSTEDRAQASEEWKKLASLPPAPNFLADQAIAYAESHAADPRAAEALHLAVRSTRYGCTDPKTGPLSKQAYDLLHQRYPNSEWANQTKYWYK